jgi:hypothetical protein
MSSSNSIDLDALKEKYWAGYFLAADLDSLMPRG